MTFILVWHKVADDEWQAGGHDTLFVILASSMTGPASFSLAYKDAPIGDYPSLDAAKTKATELFNAQA